MFGYIFRFVFLTIIVVLFFVSIKKTVKTKTKKNKVFNLVITAVCFVLFFLSVVSLDIKKPRVSEDISQVADSLSVQYLPKTDSSKTFYLYDFDCEGYYGTVSVSKVDEEEKNNVLNNKNKYALTIEDGTAVALCTHVACDRDVFGVPEKCVGDIRIFNGDTRIFIKYNYKDVEILGPIKYLTFTQYFYKEVIDLEEIAKSIVPDSLVVLDQWIKE